MRSLGERTLRDIERPEPLTELVIPDVEVSDPPDAPERIRPGDVARREAVPRPWQDRDLPDWIPGGARRWLPGGERTRDLIEQRVMSAIEEAFDEKSRRRAPRTSSPDLRPSVADEIDRLRGLRDAGALTAEQYRRAVDRVVGGTEAPEATDTG